MMLIKKNLYNPFFMILGGISLLLLFSKCNHATPPSTQFHLVDHDTNDNSLLKAIQSGDSIQVGVLLKSGLEVNLNGKFGNTALMWAIEKGQLDIIQLLINNGAKVNEEVLNYAVLVGETEIVKFLIDNGAKVNEEYLGNPPIIWAMDQGKIEIAELLIKNGADVGTMDESDTPILNVAIHKGQLELADILIEHGADINAADKHGETALIASIVEGQVDFVKALIAKKANINAIDGYGTPTLIWAVMESQTKIVQLLIDQGANVNAIDANGKTAMKWAIEKGEDEIVKILLNNKNNNCVASSNLTEEKKQVTGEPKNLIVIRPCSIDWHWPIIPSRPENLLLLNKLMRDHIQLVAEQEGVEKGFMQGRKEGIKTEKMYIAKNMLKKEFDIHSIQELTGLSAQEIKKLQQE